MTISLSTGYHPQSNLTNRTQEIGRFLHTYSHDHQKTQSQYLCWAEDAQNSLYQCTTRPTPFQCLFGSIESLTITLFRSSYLPLILGNIPPSFLAMKESWKWQRTGNDKNILASKLWKSGLVLRNEKWIDLMRHWLTLPQINSTVRWPERWKLGCPGRTEDVVHLVIAFRYRDGQIF